MNEFTTDDVDCPITGYLPDLELPSTSTYCPKYARTTLLCR